MKLYRPTDVDRANERFGATCGHAALAAILGREVSDVWQAAREAFEGRGYVSAPAMEQALSTLYRGNWRVAVSDQFPVRGLVLIQFEGPWMARGLPLGAQLARTHWVAKDGPPGDGALVYDVNADGWIRRATWEATVIPQLLAHHKRSTGWRVRRSYEVQPIFTGSTS